ncbi:MAG: TIGR00269 family protein [Candidatus Poseidoniia archaeon]|jgi:uncharacterized protein (TIGR00269 family)|nr:MAG: TIGR00269 family protein [Euryarchaeota archaeon]HIL49933.1 TIGR00269 family protein [Candidatus Poseidoniales archaeon]
MAAGISVAQCSRCPKPAILHQEYSGQHYCGQHLGQSIRKRFSKELRNTLVLPKDAHHSDGRPFRILACISGGKDSAVLLDLLVDILGKRRDVEIIAGCVDEGIDGYRAPSLECARQLAESLSIEFVTLSYEEMGYERMDEVVLRMPGIGAQHSEAKGLMPCSYCGVFRRQSLNAMSEKVNADVMALGHNLDDMAQSILMNLQKGEIERSVRLAPHTDAPIEGLAPRIVPLRWVPEQEIHAHAIAKGLPIHHGECPHAPGAMRQQSRSIVAALEAQTPGARHGLLHALEQIRELHRAANLDAHAEVTKCEECGEITSRQICQSCTMKRWLIESHSR